MFTTKEIPMCDECGSLVLPDDVCVNCGKKREKKTINPAIVPKESWGRDHESTLLYVETRCVDHGGKPERAQMRTNRRLHPGLASADYPNVRVSPPTRLADGSVLVDHDDWSCVDDMAAAGLVQNIGTGINPLWRLTDAGWAEAGRLRRKRAEAR